MKRKPKPVKLTIFSYDIDNLPQGMTTDEVLEAFGPPEKKVLIANEETWIYKLFGETQNIRFVDGKIP